MRLLGIETSCDETSAAIVEDGTKILSNVIASSQNIQSQYGGIVPEVAARKQADYIIPVLEEAFQKASLDEKSIDGIAVTIGPGLMGSLMVGVDTAKTLSYVWKKPLIPVNHLIGHIYSGWLDDTTENKPTFPLIALVISGGHTDLVLMKSHTEIELLGSTLDDAAGEAFDKVARMLELGYPGGPAIEQAAQQGDPEAFEFPRSMLTSGDYRFSYSGLKTSVLYKIKDLGKLDEQTRYDLAASFQMAALEVPVKKTIKAAQEYYAKSILVCGGVAANKKLRELTKKEILSIPTKPTLHIPPISLATDNASYIAAAGYFQFEHSKLTHEENLEELLTIEANPNLTILDF